MAHCVSRIHHPSLRLRKASLLPASKSSAVASEWTSLARPANVCSSTSPAPQSRSVTTLAEASPHALGVSSTVHRSSENSDPTVKLVVACAAWIMLSCAVLRVNFSAIAPVIVDELGLSLIQLAYIHSSFLIGYCLGQIPAGLLADRIDGYTILCVGALAWSIVTLLHAPLAIAPAGIAPMALATLRMLVGLTTAAAVPGLAATLAQALPKDQRSRAMSTCYGLFNLGSALGLGLTPVISGMVAWPVGFAFLGGLSIIMTVCAFVLLRKTLKAAPVELNTEIKRDSLTNADVLRSSPQARIYKLSPTSEDPSVLNTSAPMQALAKDSTLMPPHDEAHKGSRGVPWRELRDYAALIYHHSAIGWGFFLFQNWIPTYLQSLNVNDAILRGVLSACPWMACFLLALAFGGLFDTLRKRGMSHFRSQTLAHSIASVGAAVALIPISCFTDVAPLLGLLCIGGALSMQTCNYSGFHAYIQTNYPERAGRILGVTNSCGIGAGIAANLAMGWMVQLTGSYRPMFATTAAVYFLSWVVWLVCLREKPEKL